MAEADSESRGDSLAALASAFGDQIAVLQQTAGLRSADLSPHSRDLMELEASVQALDDSLQQIQAAMARERAAFPQVTAVTADFALPQQAAAATMALSTPNVMARPSTDHNALHSSQAKATGGGPRAAGEPPHLHQRESARLSAGSAAVQSHSGF